MYLKLFLNGKKENKNMDFIIKKDLSDVFTADRKGCLKIGELLLNNDNKICPFGLQLGDKVGKWEYVNGLVDWYLLPVVDVTRNVIKINNDFVFCLLSVTSNVAFKNNESKTVTTENSININFLIGKNKDIFKMFDETIKEKIDDSVNKLTDDEQDLLVFDEYFDAYVDKINDKKNIFKKEYLEAVVDGEFIVDENDDDKRKKLNELHILYNPLSHKNEFVRVSVKGYVDNKMLDKVDWFSNKKERADAFFRLLAGIINDFVLLKDNKEMVMFELPRVKDVLGNPLDMFHSKLGIYKIEPSVYNFYGYVNKRGFFEYVENYIDIHKFKNLYGYVERKEDSILFLNTTFEDGNIKNVWLFLRIDDGYVYIYAISKKNIIKEIEKRLYIKGNIVEKKERELIKNLLEDYVDNYFFKERMSILSFVQKYKYIYQLENYIIESMLKNISKEIL